MRNPLIIMITSLTILTSTPSFAGLGDHAVTVAIDAQKMSARFFQAHQTIQQPWTRHDLTLQDGTATEFTDASGIVFAVAWKTQTMPDLTALLSSHKSEFDQAQINQNEKIRSPRHFSAKVGDMTVVSAGHLRAFEGYAYLSTMLPQGFDFGELSK